MAGYKKHAKVEFRTARKGERVFSIYPSTGDKFDCAINQIDGWITEDGVDVPFSIAHKIEWGEVHRDLIFHDSSYSMGITIDLVLMPGEDEPTEEQIVALVGKHVTTETQSHPTLAWKSGSAPGALYAGRELIAS